MSRCLASAYQLLLSITLFNLEQGSTAHTLQHPFLSLDFRKPNVYCYAVPGNHYICPVMHTKEMDMGWRDTEIHVQTAQSIISSCLFFRKTDYLAYHFAGLQTAQSNSLDLQIVQVCHQLIHCGYITMSVSYRLCLGNPHWVYSDILSI